LTWVEALPGHHQPRRGFPEVHGNIHKGSEGSNLIS
jgi:hypothetical protein